MALLIYFIGFVLSGIVWFFFEYESPFTVEKLFDSLIVMTSSWVYLIKRAILVIDPDLLDKKIFKKEE